MTTDFNSTPTQSLTGMDLGRIPPNLTQMEGGGYALKTYWNPDSPEWLKTLAAAAVLGQSHNRNVARISLLKGTESIFVPADEIDLIVQGAIIWLPKRKIKIKLIERGFRIRSKIVIEQWTDPPAGGHSPKLTKSKFDYQSFDAEFLVLRSLPIVYYSRDWQYEIPGNLKSRRRYIVGAIEPQTQSINCAKALGTVGA